MTSPGLGALQSLGGGDASVVIRGIRAPVGRKGFYITLREGRFSYGCKVTDSTAEQLRPLQIEAVLAELQRRQARTSWFKLFVWAAVIFSVFVCFGSFGAGVNAALFFAVPGFFISRWDRARRAIRLYYDLDSPELVARFSHVNAVGQWLGWSKATWSASDMQSAQRRFVPAIRGSVAGIELNIEPWSISLGTRLIVPLPDHLVILEKRRLFAVPYERLDATSASIQVIENGTAPSDGQKIATTWRHARRDGGPDLRFSNNPSSTVMRYGTLELSTADGPLCSLVVSNAAAAEGAAHALRALSGRAAESNGARNDRVPKRSAVPAPPSSSQPATRQLPPMAPLPASRAPVQAPLLVSGPRVSPYSVSASGQPMQPVPLVYDQISSGEAASFHLPPPPRRRQPAAAKSADQTWVPWDRSVQLGGMNLGGGSCSG